MFTQHGLYIKSIEKVDNMKIKNFFIALTVTIAMYIVFYFLDYFLVVRFSAFFPTYPESKNTLLGYLYMFIFSMFTILPVLAIISGWIASKKKVKTGILFSLTVCLVLFGLVLVAFHSNPQ